MFGRILIGGIRFYQAAVSPWTPAACRFTPTCSQYAREAIEGHGAGKGSWLALRRILRCHPWGGHGFDPVPPAEAHGSTEADRLDAGSVASVDMTDTGSPGSLTAERR